MCTLRAEDERHVNGKTKLTETSTPSSLLLRLVWSSLVSLLLSFSPLILSPRPGPSPPLPSCLRWWDRRASDITGFSSREVMGKNLVDEFITPGGFKILALSQDRAKAVRARQPTSFPAVVLCTSPPHRPPPPHTHTPPQPPPPSLNPPPPPPYQPFATRSVQFSSEPSTGKKPPTWVSCTAKAYPNRGRR